MLATIHDQAQYGPPLGFSTALASPLCNRQIVSGWRRADTGTGSPSQPPPCRSPAEGSLLLALIPAAVRSQQSACVQQLAALGVDTSWVDAETPAEACTKQLCTSSVHTDCIPGTDAAGNVLPPLEQEDLQLVFSDEFNEPGRAFDVSAGDPKWTASRMWCVGGQIWRHLRCCGQLGEKAKQCARMPHARMIQEGHVSAR